MRIRRKSDMAVIGTYDYDGTCRRIAKSTSAGTTSFFWIGFELAMEYDGSGLLSRRHRGADFNEVVSAQQRDIADLDQDGSTADYVPLTPLYDGTHDCIGMLDYSGAIVESYVHTYDGAVTITNAAGGAITTSAVGWQQGYAGTFLDTETGHYYAIHRYYDPSTGRFQTQDPLGSWVDPAAAGNGYVWSGDSYRSSIDPLGLKAHGPKPKAVPKKKCPCEQFKAVIIWNSDFDKGSNWFQRKFWKGIVDIYEGKVAGARLMGGAVGSAYGGRINRIDTAAEGGEAKAIAAIKAGFSDPCLVHIAIFGHGGGGGINVGDSVLMAGDMLGKGRQREGRSGARSITY